MVRKRTLYWSVLVTEQWIWCLLKVWASDRLTVRPSYFDHWYKPCYNCIGKNEGSSFMTNFWKNMLHYMGSADLCWVILVVIFGSNRDRWNWAVMLKILKTLFENRCGALIVWWRCVFKKRMSILIIKFKVSHGEFYEEVHLIIISQEHLSIFRTFHWQWHKLCQHIKYAVH